MEHSFKEILFSRYGACLLFSIAMLVFGCVLWRQDAKVKSEGSHLLKFEHLAQYDDGIDIMV